MNTRSPFHHPSAPNTLPLPTSLDPAPHNPRKRIRRSVQIALIQHRIVQVHTRPPGAIRRARVDAIRDMDGEVEDGVHIGVVQAEILADRDLTLLAMFSQRFSG